MNETLYHDVSELTSALLSPPSYLTPFKYYSKTVFKARKLSEKTIL